jgi:alpha-tubulin suppressor-like RCC1 family protein
LIAYDGKVYCWGKNDKGQLGDGSNTDSNVPRDTNLPADAVAAGAKHTCAIVDGDVYCWGNNNKGQLGVGSTADQDVPVAVDGLPSSVIELAAGDEHTCALTSDGAVYCWGRNDKGQLGTGLLGLGLDQSTPVLILGSESATAIAAGDKYTCAVLSGGGAMCWGENNEGQLGDGTKVDRNAPTSVSGLNTDLVSIDAGSTYTCASLADGSLRCWGRLNVGASLLTPQQIIASDVRSVSVGKNHACVALTSSHAMCWGDDSRGQLGDGGSFADTVTPSLVTLIPNDLLEIEAGDEHTCSIHDSGDAYCWGDNNNGQLGTGSTGGFTGSPVQVTLP